MLTRANKEAIVTSLKGDIDNARAIFLTNLIGVTSNESVAIRKGIRDVNGKVVITRNTLFKIAAQGTLAEGLFDNLKGPHAVAFAFEDAAAVAKCLKEAGKDNEVVEFKSGILGGKELNKAELLELANLPGRDQMLATLLATFQAPISAFARVLNSIKEQKESGEEAPAEEAAPAAEATEAPGEGDKE